MRIPYLDNIRWFTVALVLIYHVCYLYNGAGVPGGIPNADHLAFFDTAASALYPWFMALLFIIAGISARYSLQRLTVRQFLKTRAVKLLMPSTAGLFAVHWITGYLNIKIGGGLPYIPSFLIYPVSVLSGIGPLWFIQMLFLFSCALALLKKADRKDRLWNICGRANTGVVLSMFLPLWGASQVLNTPVLTVYRFGIYFTAFLIGYYLFSHEKIQNLTEKIHAPTLAAAVITAVAYTARYNGKNYTDPTCLQSLLTNLYLWSAVLAILGNAKKYFNRETPFTRYMVKNSFGFYVLHYPALLLICYLLDSQSHLPAIWKYLLAWITEFAAVFLLNEIIKRIPILRFAVLGQKKNSRSRPFRCS